jgi:HEAT repeat protein
VTRPCASRALDSAGRVNSFSDAQTVAKLSGDPDAVVRKNAAELLGSLRVTDAAASLTALAKNDPNADVRGAACHSLGELRAGSARTVLEEVAKNDANGLVRDMATMALRRL